MAKVTITFPPHPPLINGAVLTIDATTSEDHDRSAMVTEHPVEQGSSVSDNIRPLPRKLSMRCLVTASPLTWPGQNQVFDSQYQGPAGTGPGPDPGLTQGAYRLLEIAAANGSVLKVQTGLALYPQMAIAGLTYQRRSGNGANLYFSLVLEEILYATAQTARVPRSAIASNTVANQIAPRKSRGNRQTLKPTAPQAARAAVLHSGPKATRFISALQGQVAYPQPVSFTP